MAKDHNHEENNLEEEFNDDDFDIEDDEDEEDEDEESEDYEEDEEETPPDDLNLKDEEEVDETEEQEEETLEVDEEESSYEDVTEEEVKAAPPMGPPVSLDEVPLTIAVEIGRIQMSMQKLLELQPGNLLELATKPESGVNLVVNGKKVGKAELLRVGNTLGVRILEI